MAKKAEGGIEAPVVSSILVRIGIVVELIAVAVVFTASATGNTEVSAYGEGVLNLLPFLVLGLTMFWCYRANHALSEVLHNELKTSAPLAAFWFIIPIASYWKPYEAVREIYQASRDREDWQGSGKTTIIAVWWVFHVVRALTAIAMKFMQMGGADMENTASLQIVALVMTVVLVVELPLLFVIVSRVTGHMRAQPRRIAADVF